MIGLQHFQHSTQVAHEPDQQTGNYVSSSILGRGVTCATVGAHKGKPLSSLFSLETQVRSLDPMHDHDFNKTSVLMEVDDQPGALHEVSISAVGGRLTALLHASRLAPM